MNLEQLKQLLTTLGIQPSRRLGQNFLIDPNLLTAMVRQAGLRPGDRVLEVGPGTGVLTRRLLEAGCSVVAIELDRRLAAYLQTEFAGEGRIEIIHADACRTHYDTIFGDSAYRCMANLPYSCSSVFLARMAASANPPRDLHVLLQHDMARRVASPPGTKAYNALTVQLMLRFTVRILRRIPPDVFYPPPEVDSAFVCFEHRDDAPAQAIRDLAAEIAGVTFRQRRKKCVTVLGGHLGSRERAQRAFRDTGLNLQARPEQLSPADFARLAACLHSQ